VILGPPGQISVHTPEVCFSSQAYTRESKRRKERLAGPHGAQDEFWLLTFRANDLHGGLLSVGYGWSTGGHWTAPNDPRFKYGGYPYLYKIQLSANIATDIKASEEDPCLKFLADFVPAAQKCLVESQRD
jgi:hypothetical protein